MLLFLLLPFAGCLVAALLPTTARNLESLFAAGVALAVALPLAALYPQVAAGAVLVQRLPWLPGLGVDLVLRIDGFAWMFAMLVSAMGLLVIVYARYYMAPQDPAARFYALLLGFMGAMLGVVVSGNLVQLVVFWELTSVFSFLLIGYWTQRKDARRGARMAFTVTGAGGLCLLAGVLLLGHIVGSLELDAVLAAGPRVREHALYAPALALVLLGALTKSAQFPFHVWLPRAMAAPTPVSAYLHSATMVKAGVFLLARLWPVLAGSDAWFWIVGGAGLASLLLGAWVAMFQHDLKGLLAYSTISHLGLITLLLGLNSELAAVAAVFHMMNHATFKASLFMSVGIIDHESGTRDMRRLRGLWRAMPVTGSLAIVASAAMAGVPLLNGFLSKEMFFAETVFIAAHPAVEIGLPLLATAAGAFAVVYSLRLAHGVFFGRGTLACPRQPHEPTHWMRVPVELLVLACVVVGTLPGWAIAPLLDTAARPVVGAELPAYSLALWHGFTAPLAMSLVASACGLAIYLRLAPRPGRARGPLALPDGERLFHRALIAGIALARGLGRHLGTRRLQPQLLLMLLAAALAGLASALVVPLSWGDRTRVPAMPAFVLLWVVAGACAIGAAWQAKQHRLAALVMLSVVGLAMCLSFAWFSAPDLALTQLAVEVVTTVLFLLGLRWLPKPAAARATPLASRAWWRRRRDQLVALAVGAGLAALSYALLTRRAPRSIAPFFLDQALPAGGGRNVVNVILVDFRAFDTLGEITVLAIVGITVYALLRRFRPPPEAMDEPAQQQAVAGRPGSDLRPRAGAADAAPPYLDVPAVLVRLLLPLAAVFALHLLLRGHNAPGGGFVAALVLAIAVVAQYVVGGTRWVEARLRLQPTRWIAAGLALALATGLGALALGYPFLSSYTAHLQWPLLGELELPTAALFDLGVFAVVVGSTLLLLTAIAHQSLRARRREDAADEAREPR